MNEKNYGRLAKWADLEETSDNLLQLSLLQNTMAINGFVPTQGQNDSSECFYLVVYFPPDPVILPLIP